MYFINPLSMTQQALTSMPGSGPFPTGPSFYGPMHQALTDYFNAGATWRADFPRYVNQLMFQPELRNMHGGFNISDIIAPQPNNDWRIDWFAEDRAKAAAAAAAAAAGLGTGGVSPAPGGLLQPWGVRQGENDIPSASADGATGNSGGSVGGTGGVGGNSSAGTSDGPGGGGGG